MWTYARCAVNHGNCTYTNAGHWFEWPVLSRCGTFCDVLVIHVSKQIEINSTLLPAVTCMSFSEQDPRFLAFVFATNTTLVGIAMLPSSSSPISTSIPYLCNRVSLFLSLFSIYAGVPTLVYTVCELVGNTLRSELMDAFVLAALLAGSLASFIGLLLLACSQELPGE